MIVSVTYPHTEGSHFDVDYYVKSHMKLVHDRWSPLGLKSFQIVRGTGTPDGKPPAATMLVLLDFESPEAFGRAVEAHGAEVMGDVPNFTDIVPSLQFNEVLG